MVGQRRPPPPPGILIRRPSDSYARVVAERAHAASVLAARPSRKPKPSTLRRAVHSGDPCRPKAQPQLQRPLPSPAEARCGTHTPSSRCSTPRAPGSPGIVLSTTLTATVLLPGTMEKPPLSPRADAMAVPVLAEDLAGLMQPERPLASDGERRESFCSEFFDGELVLHTPLLHAGGSAAYSLSGSACGRSARGSFALDEGAFALPPSSAAAAPAATTSAGLPAAAAVPPSIDPQTPSRAFTGCAAGGHCEDPTPDARKGTPPRPLQRHAQRRLPPWELVQTTVRAALEDQRRADATAAFGTARCRRGDTVPV